MPASLDRLSDLPDEILLQIISHLPIKSQAETSLLSRRWRDLWTQNRVLRLTLDSLGISEWRHDTDDADRSHRVVQDALEQWQCFHLEKLQLDVVDWYSHAPHPNAIYCWIYIAACRSVQDLRIRRCYRENHWSEYNSIFRLPTSLFACSSLSSLALDRCLPPLVGSPSAQQLCALKTLHLKGPTILYDELGSLLPVCPLLECLRIVECGYERHVNQSRVFMLSSPKLKTFQLEVETYHELEVIVAAPSLENISAYGYMKFFFRSAAPQLFRASFHDRIGLSNYSWTDDRLTANHRLLMLQHIQHVRILSIDIYLLKFIVKDWGTTRGKPVTFGNLKELHLNAMWLTDISLHAIDVFLEKHPFLETFCMMFGDGYRKVMCEDFTEDSMKEYDKYASNVYETNRGKCKLSFKDREPYLLPQLRTLKMFGFIGTKNEMRLVKFLLGSATALKSLILFCAQTIPMNPLEKLYWFYQASPVVRVLVAGGEDWMDTISSSCSSLQSIHVHVIGKRKCKNWKCDFHSSEHCYNYGEVRVMDLQFNSISREDNMDLEHCPKEQKGKGACEGSESENIHVTVKSVGAGKDAWEGSGSENKHISVKSGKGAWECSGSENTHISVKSVGPGKGAWECSGSENTHISVKSGGDFKAGSVEETD